MENQIGIQKDYADKMIKMLNNYLSNVQVFYMNVRGYHWNIKGKQFFNLHEKFEELYDTLNDMADEIAERVLMLDGTPIHAFSEYLKVATIKEKVNVSSADETVKEVLNDMKHLLKEERKIVSAASEAEDNGTVDLISGYIDSQEKLVWMYNSLLK